MNEPQSDKEATERERFMTLAKRVVSAPKKEVDAMQAEWKKTKHKRGAKDLPTNPV